MDILATYLSIRNRDVDLWTWQEERVGDIWRVALTYILTMCKIES